MPTPSAIVARFPGPVTLRSSRFKGLFLLAVSLTFSFGGYLMVRDGASGGWFVLLFFGLCLLVAVLMLLPGANGLTLDRDGFETRSMYRSAYTRWQDATGFSTARVSASHVSVIYDDARIKPGVLAATNVKLSGRNAGLQDSYGLKGEQLASLMESWRERALKQQ